jgi:hypothetical protein
MSKLVGIALLALIIVAVVVAMEELRRARLAREEAKEVAACTMPVAVE